MRGSPWPPACWPTRAGAVVESDRVDPKRFHGFKDGTFHGSTDGGASLTAKATLVWSMSRAASARCLAYDHGPSGPSTGPSAWSFAQVSRTAAARPS